LAVECVGAGCVERKSLPQTGGIDGTPTAQDFARYLKVRNLDGQSGPLLERSKENFFQRNALARTIAGENVVDIDLITAEVRDYRNERLIAKYFADYLSSKVNDDLARQYYSENKDKFAQFKVRVAQILIAGSIKSHDSDERDVLMAKAVDVHAKLKAGASFESVAKKYSDDPKSSKNGGDIGWIVSKQLPTGMAVKIRGMKAGEVSDPIATPDGYCIVRLLSDVESVTPEFDTVKSEVLTQLRYERKTKETARLMQKAHVPEEKS